MYLDTDGMTLRFSSSFDTSDVNGIYNLEEYKSLCDEGALLFLRNRVLFWKLSKEFLEAFKEVIICTYQFRGTLLETFLVSNKLEYSVNCWGNKPSSIKNLINLYDGKLNQSSDKSMFNYGWFDDQNNREFASKLLVNYFMNINKASANDRLWSCYDSYYDNNTKELIGNLHTSIGTKQYKKQWLAYNTKATNNYAHVHSIAYLVNLHYKPEYKDLVSKTNKLSDPEFKVDLNEDLYAISEMVQFIFRSAIRKGESINLFIPSKRMRTILQSWLDDEYESYRNYEK